MATGVVSPSDYVVGQYDEQGRKTRRGGAAGGTTTEAQIRSRLARFMQNRGEPLMLPKPPAPVAAPVVTIKAKRGRKAKIAEVVELPAADCVQAEVKPAQAESYYTPTTANSNVIVFDTSYGKIKVMTQAVMETETGVALLFSHADEVRFTPEQGSELNVTINGKAIKLMYLGMTFQWFNSPQQLMVFIKSEI